jgi:glutamate racemase
MIGVFDSGHGGLTVQTALTRALPNQTFVYLGDHAYAPYGTKDQEQIVALTAIGLETLFGLGCRLVILACNTASAVALRVLQQNWLPTAYPQHRILGVVVPMVEAITRMPWSMVDRAPLADHPPTLVGIFGTPSTVASGAFPLEIARRSSGIEVVQQACPGLASAIEDGLADDQITALVQCYSGELLAKVKGLTLDSVVLGCTHYPLVASQFRRFLPASAELLSQPELVAASLKDYLRRHPEFAGSGVGSVRFLTTGAPEQVSRIASRFLGQAVRFESRDGSARVASCV